MTKSKIVLVTGATGKQGGAVARALLANGTGVRAMTRNTTSKAAQALIDAGASVVAGDFAEPASVAAAMRDVDAVFAMTTPFEAGHEAETQQGIALVDAAVKAGVDHFVYTSVASADQATSIPHFDSKYAVEQHLASTDLAWTVIAPVYFMENLFFPQSLDALRSGAYAAPLPEDLDLQQIAAADIGGFGAHVIQERDAFVGQRIDIAGDELSSKACASVLGEVLSRDVGFHQIPMDQIRAFSEDMALMYEWFISTGYSVDIPALRQRFPEVRWHRFAEWAEENVPDALK